ncbi:hypothetical protein [Streptomyces sp. NPDC026673]|uniref:hypothetical protein n=1 Tax=Streptomyces sp. NPDC026673 TaxID=3155724 RepID=UPI00340520E7
MDLDRITVAGSGDGASYALGLGTANGDLFTRVLAYSPTCLPAACRTGRPTVLLSHTRHHTDALAAAAGHRILATLEHHGYHGYHVDHIEHSHGRRTPGDVVATSAELLGRNDTGPGPPPRSRAARPAARRQEASHPRNRHQPAP